MNICLYFICMHICMYKHIFYIAKAMHFRRQRPRYIFSTLRKQKKTNIFSTLRKQKQKTYFLHCESKNKKKHIFFIAKAKQGKGIMHLYMHTCMPA